MTIYAIKNLINNTYEYVTDYQELVTSTTHVTCIFGTKEIAEAKRLENINSFLMQESYRFSIAKEVVEGLNTTWTAVTDLDSDDHADGYYVFNTITGQHEKVTTKLEVKQKVEEIKQAFLVHSGVEDVSIVNSIPSKTPSLEERYGAVNGSR